MSDAQMDLIQRVRCFIHKRYNPDESKYRPVGELLFFMNHENTITDRPYAYCEKCLREWGDSDKLRPPERSYSDWEEIPQDEAIELFRKFDRDYSEDDDDMVSCRE